MSRFKIIVFLMAMGVLAGIFATAWWFYIRVIAPDAEVASELSHMHGKGALPPDPGIKRFEKAIELIQESDLDGGRAALYELVRTFPESSRVTESKRIIGEINMDMLFDADNPLKKDYIVQPGDSLNLIATKQGTTVDSIIRSSGLMSFNLQPGDHLTIIPMDFHLGVSVSKKQVMLLRKVGDKEYLFKVYEAKDIRLPPGTRLPVEMEISGKNTIYDGKPIISTDPNYLDADK